MRDIAHLQQEIANAQAELSRIYAMPEKEACTSYNVETKVEIIAMMRDIIDNLNSELKEAKAHCDLDASGNSPDPGFCSWGDYFQYVY